MPFTLMPEQLESLSIITNQKPEDVVELCKVSFDYLINGAKPDTINVLAKKYNTNNKKLIKSLEGLISFIVDATKFNASHEEIMNLHQKTNFSNEILEILSQFVSSKKNRRFVESSIKTANLRSYRIFHIEWRLETRIASRCLLKQNNTVVLMKLYLHTEPKNENRDLLPEEENNIVHPEERRNRKDIIVQTDIGSLLHIIQTLEDALMESKTRRVKNLVAALH